MSTTFLGMGIPSSSLVFILYGVWTFMLFSKNNAGCPELVVSLPFLWERDLSQPKSMLLHFCDTSWLYIWTFWLLVTLYSLQRGKIMCAKLNKSLNAQCEHDITQRVHLMPLLRYIKNLFLTNPQFFIKFVFRVFLYLNPLTIHVVSGQSLW